MIKTFGEDVFVQTCNAFGTAITDGDFPASGSYIDVSDFERFAFVVVAGTLNTALTLQVQQAATVSGSTSNITGATATIGTSDDNEVFIIEVETRRLTLTGQRYVTLDIAGASGGDDYASVVFYGLNKGSVPVTQHASTNTPVIVAG
jgi:hypothetical protein